ncbi:hypothetical protein GS502_10790 [Rhodococcus hoagii]|nr:hypothetical protein [Prescottella equi]
MIDLPRTPLIAAALPQMPRVLIDGELIPIITQHWVAALNGEGALGAQLRARSTADAKLGSAGGMVAVAIPRMFAVMALGGLGTLTASLKAKGPVVKTAQFKGVGSMAARAASAYPLARLRSLAGARRRWWTGRLPTPTRGCPAGRR